jgi:LPXTG-site transpeptidase (sortase) family protein
MLRTSLLPFKQSCDRMSERLDGTWRRARQGCDGLWWGIRKANWREQLPSALMLTGLALLLYVGIQYGTMLAAQRRLSHQWEQQQKSAAARGLVVNDGLVRLCIPKIDLSAVVVEGTTHKALLIGPGHLEDTPEPGSPGNSVISGHRDTFFRHLHKLGKGDEVLVQHKGQTYSYRVTGKKIVSPYDVSVIKPSDGSHLTLITCYPTYYVGPAPERLVIFTEQENPQSSAAESARGPEVRPASLGAALGAASAKSAAR